jgi:hypothetical protein
MRKPKYIRDLEAYGVEFDLLTAFRRELDPFGVTVCWNDRLRVWVLGRFGRGAGCVFQTCKVGPEALAGMIADGYAKTVAQFDELDRERTEQETANAG